MRCEIEFVAYKLLVITVYLPYENDVSQAGNLYEQLFVIESIINLNPDGHTVVRSDFNVDFARNWRH